LFLIKPTLQQNIHLVTTKSSKKKNGKEYQHFKKLFVPLPNNF